MKKTFDVYIVNASYAMSTDKKKKKTMIYLRWCCFALCICAESLFDEKKDNTTRSALRFFFVLCRNGYALIKELTYNNIWFVYKIFAFISRFLFTFYPWKNILLINFLIYENGKKQLHVLRRCICNRLYSYLYVHVKIYLKYFFFVKIKITSTPLDKKH